MGHTVHALVAALTKEKRRKEDKKVWRGFVIKSNLLAFFFLHFYSSFVAGYAPCGVCTKDPKNRQI